MRCVLWNCIRCVDRDGGCRPLLHCIVVPYRDVLSAQAKREAKREKAQKEKDKEKKERMDKEARREAKKAKEVKKDKAIKKERDKDAVKKEVKKELKKGVHPTTPKAKPATATLKDVGVTTATPTAHAKNTAKRKIKVEPSTTASATTPKPKPAPAPEQAPPPKPLLPCARPGCSQKRTPSSKYCGDACGMETGRGLLKQLVIQQVLPSDMDEVQCTAHRTPHRICAASVQRPRTA